MKREHLNALMAIGFLVALAFIAMQQQVGRAGTIFPTIADALSHCSPGLKIWTDSTSIVLGSDQPPSGYVLNQSCPDGTVCCRLSEGNYSNRLYSQCPSYPVYSDLCIPHECETNSECGIKNIAAQNDCSLLWEPHDYTSTGTCSNYKCVYSNAATPSSCSETQVWLQNYKWYLAAGIVVLLMAALILTSRRRR